MSAQPVEPISSPADLDLSHEHFRVLTESLTEQGWRNFMRELIEAIERAQERNDLRPVRDTMESWYRTLLIRQTPGYEANLAWARTSKERAGVPVEEILDSLRD